MYALNLNLTPDPINCSAIAGKWKVILCDKRSSDMGKTEIACYRADHFTAVFDLLSRMTDKVPVKVELVGFYYYELYFDIDDKIDELPFDLSVFLHFLY